MAVFSWLGRLFGIRDEQPWAEIAGGSRSDTGEIINVDTVQQLSTAYACIGLISRTVAALPLSVYERKKDDSREPAPDHPVAQLLRQPSSDMNGFEFVEAQIQQLLTYGNSFTEKSGAQPDAKDYPVSLNLLKPQMLSVSRDTMGALRFEYTEGDKTRTISEKKMFLLRGHYAGGDLGMSPVQYGLNAFGLALSADKTSAKLFQNGLKSAGFVKIAQQIKDKSQRDAFVKLWIEPLVGANNAGKIGVLESGMEWIGTEIKAVDQELLSSRRFSVEEICRFFGVPPIMVGHASEGQTMWGSGIEQINLAFLIHTIRPWLRRYQAAASTRLFTPVDRKRYYLEFNVDGLLEADSAGRAIMYASGKTNGWMTTNEIRKKENMPRSAQKGADELVAQGALVPLDKLGEKQQSSATAPPADPSERNNAAS